MDKSPEQSHSIISVNPELSKSPPGVSPQNIIPTPKPFRKFPFLLAGLALLFGGVLVGFFLAKSSLIDQSPIKPTGVACTMEAKICPDGSAVGRTGPKCEFSPCPQITTTSPSVTPDPTAGWNMYQGNKFSFKHPVDLEIREQGLENQVKEISIVYMRPGYNRPQSDISDGYTFSVHFGTFIQAETLEKAVEQQQEQTKAACSQASFSLIKQALVDKEKALTYETAGCFGSYITTITSRNNEIFQIIQSFSGPVEQINIYKVNLDQILSTFKFIDQDIGQECRVDSDCGVNMCDCKAEPKQNLTPAMQACLRVCEGSVKCVNAVCVLSK